MFWLVLPNIGCDTATTHASRKQPKPQCRRTRRAVLAVIPDAGVPAALVTTSAGVPAESEITITESCRRTRRVGDYDHRKLQANGRIYKGQCSSDWVDQGTRGSARATALAKVQGAVLERLGWPRYKGPPTSGCPGSTPNPTDVIISTSTFRVPSSTPLSSRARQRAAARACIV